MKMEEKQLTVGLCGLKTGMMTRKALDSDSDRAILDDFLAEAGEKK